MAKPFLWFVPFSYAPADLSWQRPGPYGKGIGYSIVLWLFFAILFDGLLLFFVFQFADYPIEKPMIGFSFFSPIDLARIMILMKLDASIMMGYTGAVFKKFLGTSLGITAPIAGIILWIILPLFFSLKLFKKKDL